MAQKPSIPKGTRDFGPQEMAERNYIFDTIRSVFRTYGYAQIETPSMENLSTLLGKYGDEGDKLLFRILNSGEAFSGIDFEGFRLEDGGINSKALSLKVCEKGLRYDLTVPFARFVVQHQNEIAFPFKRFQMQPVWRADRPQKGRYREFYQCDVDAIGSRSQLCELELVQIVDKVFSLLDVRVLMKINNRKVLTGLAEICGFPDKVVDITVAIDKLDKIGLEAVKEEMMEKGLSADSLAPDFVELVQRHAEVGDLIDVAENLGDAAEDLAVVDFHHDIDAEGAEHLIGDFHQFGLIEQGVAADDIDIALVELAITAFLRTVGAPHRLNLIAFKRQLQLVSVHDDKSCEWHC